MPTRSAGGDASGSRPGGQSPPRGASSAQASKAEEVRLARSVDALLEAYRRLARPEKALRAWTPERWAVLVQVLARLRTLAAGCQWQLESPAAHLSQDPEALAATGIDDPTLSAATVDGAEAALDVRVLRVAARLASRKPRTAAAAAAMAHLSTEALAFARLVLSTLRAVLGGLELVGEGGDRSKALEKLAFAYTAFAAGIACLRKHLASEIDEMLGASQDPLRMAAAAACRLGARDARPIEQALADPQAEKAPKAEDAFQSLHQAALLAMISSLAERGRPRLLEAPSRNNRNRALERVLAGIEDSDEDGEGDDTRATAVVASKDLPAIFTVAQLKLMRQAVHEGRPACAGGKALLKDTLEAYARLAQAIAAAYGDLQALRANPAMLERHDSLMRLVRQLHSSWSNVGMVLMPAQEADLVALEQVRLRHEALVHRLYRNGGHEHAAVVLARLAIVDEMLEDEERRRLTGDVPLEFARPYQLVAETIACLEGTGGGIAAEQPVRRRRWLRCPHATVQLVLAGEVWRQLLRRFMSCDIAFQPLGTCMDFPLTLREFRIAMCFLEMGLNERNTGLVYDSVADFASGSASLNALQGLLVKNGSKGSGDFGVAFEAAAMAVRSAPGPVAETKQAPAGEEKKDGENEAKEDEEAAETKASASPRRSNIVCHRCLCGDLPNFPHISVGELHRGCPAVREKSGDAQSGAEGSRSRSKDSKATRLGAGAANLSIQLGIAECDEDAEREFGEDTIIAWATTILANGILLASGEKGEYFRWMSRTVLYHAPRQSRSPQPVAKASVAAKPATQARRTSFATALSKATGGPAGPPRAAAAAPALPPPGAAVAAESGERSNRSFEALDAAGEAEEDRDTERDNSTSLPEEVLSALRTDIGLPKQTAAQPAEPTAASAGRRASFGTGCGQTGERRRSLGAALLDSFQSLGDLETMRARRAVREKRMVALLRELDVPAADLKRLSAEINAAVDTPGPSGLLLTGKSGKVAQSILIPNPGLKTLQASEAKAEVLAKPSSEEPELRMVDTYRTAMDVIWASSCNSQQCYLSAGYDPNSKTRCQIATALRFLEQEMFAPVETSSSRKGDAKTPGSKAAKDSSKAAGAPEPDESTLALAPLLLPAAAAERLVAQLRREEAAERAAAEAAAKAAAEADWPERRTRTATMVRVLSLEQHDAGQSASDDSGDDSPQSLNKRSPVTFPRKGVPKASPSPQSSRSYASSHRDVQTPMSPCRRSPTPTSAAHRAFGLGAVGRDPDLAGRSPTPPSPWAKGQGGGHQLTKSSSLPGTLHDAPLDDLWGDMQDWPPSVRSLFDQVNHRGQRIRGSVLHRSSSSAGSGHSPLALPHVSSTCAGWTLTSFASSGLALSRQKRRLRTPDDELRLTIQSPPFAFRHLD